MLGLAQLSLELVKAQMKGTTIVELRKYSAQLDNVRLQQEERKKAQAAKKVAPPDVPEQEPPAPPKQPDSDDEPNPAQGLEYQLTGQGLGMVELGPDGVVGCADEDEELPPGR